MLSSALWVTSPGTTTLPGGVSRVFVNAGGLVTLVLPLNDVLVMDRGPQAAAFPVTLQAPGGTTIDGNPTFVLVNNWAIADVVYDGANFGLA